MKTRTASQWQRQGNVAQSSHGYRHFRPEADFQSGCTYAGSG